MDRKNVGVIVIVLFLVVAIGLGYIVEKGTQKNNLSTNHDQEDTSY